MSRLSDTYSRVAQFVDHKIGWDRLPTPLGLAVLIGLRNAMRRQNLHDTTQLPSTGASPLPPWHASFRTMRTVDGTYNDLDHPEMGRAGSRFGRNVSLEAVSAETPSQMMSPNPRTVSRELLTRHEFQPATTLNALAGAWLQFMVRDWISHPEGSSDDVWEVALVDSDPWPEHPMRIRRTPADPTRPPDSSGPPTFVNTETHWWDGSQIYGSDAEGQKRRRTGSGGKLHIGDDGRLVLPQDPELNPALDPGWWLGVSLMGSLFVLEHNAICDALTRQYPSWSDEELFQRARLINAAVMAKIHTIEWTPALIAHPSTRAAMHAQWYGLAGEWVKKTFGRLGKSEVLSGIPGAPTQHFGVPYSLTEEFSAVYRMHPLIPDDWVFRSAGDDGLIEERPFRELTGLQAQEIQERISLTDLLYSFGGMHPGALRLHNFPRDLQHFVRPDGEIMDLAAVDIFRCRELGVARYNELRRQLHLTPAESFEDLTDNPQWADELRRVYDDDIEAVDLPVGMFAEPLPKGFAFSDTAFRIFIVMASRRLNSDRFFTSDFTPEVYTPLGMRWIEDTGMSTVLLRHFPGLRPALLGVTNAFHPWNAAAA